METRPERDVSYVPFFVLHKLDLFLQLFLETLEWSFRASYLSGQQKVTAVEGAVMRIDLVKFFLLVGWEIDMITDKQYAHLSAPLVEASKMLVGWKEYLETKTPQARG